MTTQIFAMLSVSRSNGLAMPCTLPATAKKRLRLIAKQSPGLVLLDLQMPVMDGWQVHERLRRARVRVPVVFMSARHDARTEALRHHAAGYLR